MTDSPPEPLDKPQSWPHIPPFQQHLGIETVQARDGRSLLRFDFQPEHANRKGDVHGGILATLVDIAMSQAIRSLRPELRGSSTISMTVNYLETAAGRIHARGKAIRVGGSIAVAEATCESEDGRILVHATGSFRMIRHKEA